MAENITLKFPCDIDKIKPLGRYQLLPSSLGCDHSATGFEISLKAMGKVCVRLFTTNEKEGSDNTYFTVYIDGERQNMRYEAHFGETLLEIADFKTYSEHTLRFVKQTESNYNLCEIKSISFEGELLSKPQKREKYIEYIGDSLSCGMGAIGEKGVPFPQSSLWEDVTKGYTYLSAEALGVDYSIVSESGIGLAGSWFDPLFEFYPAWSYKRNKTLKYDFARIPDLLVINLGTNDFYLNCDLKICPLDEFRQKVKEFILFVRGAYKKDIPIVWVSRFMRLGESYVGAIDEVISDMGGESAGIYRLDVTQSAGGAQGHPNVSGHATASNELVEFIKNKKLL